MSALKKNEKAYKHSLFIEHKHIKTIKRGEVGALNLCQRNQIENWIKMNNSASAIVSPFIMKLILHTLLSTKLQPFLVKVTKFSGRFKPVISGNLQTFNGLCSFYEIL